MPKKDLKLEPIKQKDVFINRCGGNAVVVSCVWRVGGGHRVRYSANSCGLNACNELPKRQFDKVFMPVDQQVYMWAKTLNHNPGIVAKEVVGRAVVQRVLRVDLDTANQVLSVAVAINSAAWESDGMVKLHNNSVCLK